MPIEPGTAGQDKSYALLSYAFILCIIPLVLRKESSFVHFHARQGLALFLCEMALFILSIVFPFLLRPALFIFGLISLWGMVKVLNAEEFQIPFISSLAQKIDI
jgi:uncharacterized membrane protein